MPEAAMASLCGVQFLYQYEVGLLCLANDHLRDTVAVMNRLRFVAQVDQYNFYLSPVIAINGARCVETGNALFDRQPASWPYLRFITIRQFYK